MNVLHGQIAAVESCGSVFLIEVAVGARCYAATLLGVGDEPTAWSPGLPVRLLFKETEVALAKNLSGLISLRNRMPGTVAALERGKVLSQVTLHVDGHAIRSVITTRSLDMMALAVGDEIEGLVKANEMTVLAEPSL